MRPLDVVPILAAVLGGCATLPDPILGPTAGDGDGPLEYEARVGPASSEFETPPLESTGDDDPSRPIVSIAARFALLDESARQRVGLDGQARMRLLDPAARYAIEAVFDGPNATLLTAPRLNVFDEQAGTITIGEQRAFVGAYEVTADGEARIADPVIDAARFGTTLHVRPTVAADGIDLDLEVRRSRLIEMSVHEARVLDQTVTVEAPLTHTERVSGRSPRLADPATILVEGFETEDGGTLVVLLTIARIEDHLERPEAPAAAARVIEADERRPGS